MSYVFVGESAEVTMDMVRHMAEYLAGPGLPGFVAWLDQEYAHAPQAPSADAVRENLSILGERIDAAMVSGG